ncbi:hypothetical protein ACLM5J_10190 [Nocardioides sp. Bht2]|uniref:hypothetical protein n=1 Tax=Nocardioides sp. Bht2 TaxID=3392297 RepID=UPI0039B3DC32
MSLPWKWLLGAAVLLPVLAYAAGAVVAGSDRPTERTPIVVEEPEQPTGRQRDDIPDEIDDDDSEPSKRPEVVRPDPRTAQGGAVDNDDDDGDDDEDDADDDDDDD